MRQQHWTDHKISLCVCQSGSQSVTQNETPSISREQWKLETSNLAHTLATVDPNENMQNQVKGVVMGSRDLILEF